MDLFMATPAVCAERLAQSCSRQATIRRRSRVVPRFPFNGIIVAALPSRLIFSCGFARHSATPAGEVELLPADYHLKKILHCATFSSLLELLQLHYSVALFLCGFAHHSTTLAFYTERLTALLPADYHLKKTVHSAAFPPVMELLPASALLSSIILTSFVTSPNPATEIQLFYIPHAIYT